MEADSRALGYRSHGSAELSLSAVGHAHGSLFISFSWEIKTVTPQIILAELAHLIKKIGIQCLVCRWLLLSARSKDKEEPKPNAVIPGDQQQAQGLGWGLQHTRKLFSLSLFLKTKPRLNNINMDRGQHRCRQRTCRQRTCRQARTNTWSVWLPTPQTRLMITCLQLIYVLLDMRICTIFCINGITQYNFCGFCQHSISVIFSNLSF